MKLNCDLGESYGAWSMPLDSTIMAQIDQANIACGYNAGDPLVMKQALALAKAHNVEVGAHPSYPDLQGFGRRSMSIPADELTAMIQYQVSALQGMALLSGTNVTYVKPHGALYNDMMKSIDIMLVVMNSIRAMGEPSLALMIQATSQNEQYQAMAEEVNVPLYFEAFADRRYTDDGLLQSRAIDGAVLSESQALEQAKQLIEEGTVTTATGKSLTITAHSLCVHGDTQGAVDIAKRIKRLIR